MRDPTAAPHTFHCRHPPPCLQPQRSRFHLLRPHAEAVRSPSPPFNRRPHLLISIIPQIAGCHSDSRGTAGRREAFGGVDGGELRRFPAGSQKYFPPFYDRNTKATYGFCSQQNGTKRKVIKKLFNRFLCVFLCLPATIVSEADSGAIGPFWKMVGGLFELVVKRFYCRTNVTVRGSGCRGLSGHCPLPSRQPPSLPHSSLHPSIYPSGHGLDTSHAAQPEPSPSLNDISSQEVESEPVGFRFSLHQRREMGLCLTVKSRVSTILRS